MTAPGVARGQELSRKTLHLTTASVPVCLAFGLPQRLVAAILVGLFGVACVVEFARRRSPTVAAWFNATVGDMLRPHEMTNGITGATWLLAAFALTTLAAPLSAAIAATWAGAMGDASAAVVGTAWRRWRGGSGKSLAGSLACAATTALGAWWLAGVTPGWAALLGVIAALAERPTRGLDDNVRVTAAVALAAVVLLGR
jgi:dolichol kinase